MCTQTAAALYPIIAHCNRSNVMMKETSGFLVEDLALQTLTICTKSIVASWCVYTGSLDGGG